MLKNTSYDQFSQWLYYHQLLIFMSEYVGLPYCSKCLIACLHSLVLNLFPILKKTTNGVMTFLGPLAKGKQLLFGPHPTIKMTTVVYILYIDSQIIYTKLFCSLIWSHMGKVQLIGCFVSEVASGDVYDGWECQPLPCGRFHLIFGRANCPSEE